MGTGNQTGVRDYAVVSAAYWAFTLTDGALRMLVLLHLHERGFSPFELASLFLLYELFGVVTNLLGGWIGARFGLRTTLLGGLALQVGALGMLCVDPSFLSVGWVMTAQAFSGVAKDLTKMSSKSWVRLVVPEGDQRGLLRWVAWLTGSKNTLKGVGFFLGGALLATVGFRAACAGMAGAIAVVLAVAGALLPRTAGKGRAGARLTSLFSSDPRLNLLSAARFLLFGARDVWFVIALPVFLAQEVGWSHGAVGAFLALWVIGYGAVQAAAPAFVGGARRRGEHGPGARALTAWTALLLLPLAGILVALRTGADPAATLALGLAAFGALFAADSAIHSYLVVRYAARDRVAQSVGFYYAANAAGRLMGTLLSGALYGAAAGTRGLEWCLLAAALLVAAAAGLGVPLNRAERRSAAAATVSP